VTRLELFVRLTDGSGRVEATERDDPAGRRAIERVAFERLSHSAVTGAEIRRVDRCANTRGAGRWR
jgi:hypothetical protein